MTEADRFRAPAEDYRQMPTKAVTSLDKEDWLKLADDWLQLAHNADRRERR